MKIFKHNIKYTFAPVLAVLGLAVFALSCDPNEAQIVTTFDNLVWEDNFNAEGTPNSEHWGYDLGDGTAQGIPGWGNNELQYYTDRPENVSVQNGYLLITARQEEYQGAAYTSSRLVTRNLFEQQYGRFEARIRMPFGKGYWPAFWMLGASCEDTVWPQCGEIDIMEFLGDQPTTVFGSVHGPGYSGANAITKDYVLENSRFDTEFHVFGIEWGPDYINYYVDDVLYNQITPEDVTGEWVFNQPFYMILNVAVGGNFPGNPNNETIFPQTMLVDYVRVYSN